MLKYLLRSLVSELLLTIAFLVVALVELSPEKYLVNKKIPGDSIGMCMAKEALYVTCDHPFLIIPE